MFKFSPQKAEETHRIKHEEQNTMAAPRQEQSLCYVRPFPKAGDPERSGWDRPMTPSCPSSFVDAKNDGFKQSFVPHWVTERGAFCETWCMAATCFQREIRLRERKCRIHKKGLRDFINRSGLAAYYQWDFTPTGSWFQFHFADNKHPRGYPDRM